MSYEVENHPPATTVVIVKKADGSSHIERKTLRSNGYHVAIKTQAEFYSSRVGTLCFLKPV